MRFNLEVGAIEQFHPNWRVKRIQPMDVDLMKGMTNLDSAEELMLLNCGVGEDS